MLDEPEAEAEHRQAADGHEHGACLRELEQKCDFARPLPPARNLERDSGQDHTAGEEDRAEDVKEQSELVGQWDIVPFTSPTFSKPT